MTTWEIMEDDDEMKIIESGSMEKGYGWHSYIKVCGDIDDVKNANIIVAAPELMEALQAAMAWIDAVPQDVQLPTMPGFDRDWVDGIIAKALGRS
ncbi:hypothetical protein ABI244_05490 [Serratia ureilytica]|uniref:hypothetical protein n=1 Tax=Serratia ureilytica TaxID=300181 RepID=UPI00326473FE